MSIDQRYRGARKRAARPVLRKIASTPEYTFTDVDEVVAEVHEHPREHFDDWDWEDLLFAITLSDDTLDTRELAAEHEDPYFLAQELVRESLHADLTNFITNSTKARRSLAVHSVLNQLRRETPENLTRIVDEVHAFPTECDYELGGPAPYALPTGDSVNVIDELDESNFHEGHVRAAVLVDPFGRYSVVDTLYAWAAEKHTDLLPEYVLV